MLRARARALSSNCDPHRPGDRALSADFYEKRANFLVAGALSDAQLERTGGGDTLLINIGELACAASVDKFASTCAWIPRCGNPSGTLILGFANESPKIDFEIFFAFKFLLKELHTTSKTGLFGSIFSNSYHLHVTING